MLWTHEAQPSESTTDKINVKENVFFSEGDQERDTSDASSVVWTLIDNDKLAYQIARLVAIVLKLTD